MYSRLIAVTLLALTFPGILASAGPMSADAVKSLLTNNTMDCRNHQKNNENSNYFRDDGTATRLTPEGVKIQGAWYVTDTGEHCVDWGEHERCAAILDQGNGTYQKLENGTPRAEFTVTQGNPYKL